MNIKIIKRLSIYLLSIILVINFFNNPEYIKAASTGYHNVGHTWNHTSHNSSSDCNGCTAVAGKTNCSTCGASGKVKCIQCSGYGYTRTVSYTSAGTLVPGTTSKYFKMYVKQTGCSYCGGNSSTSKVSYYSTMSETSSSFITSTGSLKAGSGKEKCTTCGGDGAKSSTCSKCNGKGWNYKCKNSNCKQGYNDSWDHWKTESDYSSVCYEEANTYTVKYNGNGATSGSTDKSSHTYDKAKKLTANGFKRTGYTFKGWAKSASGDVKYDNKESVKNLTSTDDGTVTLYAVWKANTYTIEYKGNGATSGSMEDTTHTYDTAKALRTNAYKRTGYTFKGWAKSEDATSAKYDNKESVKNLTSTNKGTITLYAVWEVNTYSVKYNANGGTGSMSNSKHTYNSAKALTANAFKRTGYTFLGWAKTDDATSVAYTNKQSVKNLSSTDGATVNLYAVWKANTYTVTYNGNGASSGSMSKSTHTYNIAKNLTANAFKRSGYDFIGWGTKYNATSATYTNKQSVKNLKSAQGDNLILYALWKRTEKTVTYNTNGGTFSDATTTKTSKCYVNDAVNLNLTATKPGYIFVGWATESDGDVLDSYDMPNSNITLYARYSASVSGLHQKAFFVIWNKTNKQKKYQFNIPIKDETTSGYMYAISGLNATTSSLGTNIDGAFFVYDNANNYKAIKFKNNSIEEPEITIPNIYTQTTIFKFYDIAANDYSIIKLSESIAENTSYKPLSLPITLNGVGYKAPNGYYGGVTFSSTTGNTSATTSYTVDGEETHTYVYQPKSYVITLDANGGVHTNGSETSNYNVKYSGYYGSLPIPTREGHTFLGWYTEKSINSGVTNGRRISSTDVYTIAGNSTLYAAWKENTYHIIFDYGTNGGKTSSDEATKVVSICYGDTVTPDLLVEDGIKEGWEFIGWSKNPTSTTSDASFTMSVPSSGDSITLFALYKKTYTYTFKDSIGNQVITEILYNKETTGFIETPSIRDYTDWDVLGWTSSVTAEETYEKAQNIEYEIYDTSPVTMTYYAVYKKNIVIDFIVPDECNVIASISKDIYYNVGGSKTTLTFLIPTPSERENYTFVGWECSNGTEYLHTEKESDADWAITTIDSLTFTSTWNAYPKLYVSDYYFTLNRAISGEITSEVLLKDILATDEEDGEITDDTKLYIVNFNASEYTSLTCGAIFNITYRVRDEFGHVVEKEATVHIVDTDTRKDTYVSASRFIEERYLSGLADRSIWKTNLIYKTALSNALTSRSEKVSIEGMKYTFTAADIKAMKEYVKANGFSDIEDKNGRYGFRNLFMKGED